MFAVLDFETTSLSADRRATEIGVVLLDAHFTVEYEFTSLISGATAASPFALRASGLTQEEINRGPTFEAIWPELKPLLTGRIAVAHNAPFDRQVLANEYKHAGLRAPLPDFLCTLQLATRQLAGQVPNHKLATVAAHFKISLDYAHEALADAHATAMIFTEFAKRSEALQREIAGFAERLPSREVPLTSRSLAVRRSTLDSRQSAVRLSPEEIAKEIVANRRVRSIMCTGTLRRSDSEWHELARAVELEFKPGQDPGQSCAFLVTGTKGIGARKLSKAAEWQRPIVDEETAIAIVAALRGGKGARLQ